MHIGITGGAGFIGANLARRCTTEGWEVSVFDDFSTGLSSNLDELPVEVTRASLVDLDFVRQFVGSVDRVVHLGARGSVPRSIRNPVATHAVNATGTFNILEAARKDGKPVIFSSSSSVYGRNGELPKLETQWTGPLTPYAASKLAGEAYAQAYSAAYDFNVLTFRFFNVFGPWQRPDHDYAAVIPKWIWKAMHGESIDVHGDGAQTRDFTSVSTVVEVIVDAIKRDVCHPGPVNLAYGNSVSLLDLVDNLRQYFPDLRTNHTETRTGDVRNSQNDPTLLTSLFPTISPQPFSLAIKSTIEWLQQEGQRVANGPAVAD